MPARARLCRTSDRRTRHKTPGMLSCGNYSALDSKEPFAHDSRKFSLKPPSASFGGSHADNVEKHPHSVAHRCNTDLRGWRDAGNPIAKQRCNFDQTRRSYQRNSHFREWQTPEEGACDARKPVNGGEDGNANRQVRSLPIF